MPAGTPGHLAFDPDAGGSWLDENGHAPRPFVIEVVSDDCDGNGVPDVFQLAHGWTDPCLPLSADGTTLRLSTGGAQNFSFHPGPQPLGSLYLLAGSMTGTSPGVVLDGHLVPLNYDKYTTYTLELLNTAQYVNTLGALLPDGTPPLPISIVVPPGLPPGIAGATIHHAVVVFDVLSSPGIPVVTFARNAVPLTFTL